MHINVAFRSLLQGSEHTLKGVPSLLPQAYLDSAFLLLPQTLRYHFPLLSLSANSVPWQPLQSSPFIISTQPSPFCLFLIYEEE